MGFSINISSEFYISLFTTMFTMNKWASNSLNLFIYFYYEVELHVKSLLLWPF